MKDNFCTVYKILVTIKAEQPSFRTLDKEPDLQLVSEEKIRTDKINVYERATFGLDNSFWVMYPFILVV